MSRVNTRQIATRENFNATEIDLEANAVPEVQSEVINNDEEMMNIGEFVFDHITAPTTGS
jgi:hypothetical protein